MMEEMNPAMALAYDYVETTNTTIFLTGKAGTGKTTFLQFVKKNSKKKMAIVAPTGVAAINAGGMTIHSMFQMPFGPIIPSSTARPEVHFSPEKKELLFNLELLVIDEVSMVRPDVLDYIDLVLRNIKDSSFPFGGVQLFLIGDLSQLSPIIRDEEWMMLSRYYANQYFFSSQVLQRTPFVRIELDHVFRQKEQAFVDILNEVRNNAISAESLAVLNARYQPNFRPTVEEPYITLTTHNGIAQKLNNEFIEALEGKELEFKATIRGEFPKDAYPTEVNLKLKIGAQVMFVKNDTSAEKLFYNGKIGLVTAIESDTVFVQCGNESKEIAVQALEWTNIKYQLDEEQINETNAGSFAQIPLKLAWAITIHKSQGLSFDKAIIDVSEAFAHGQVYVALSRCRTLQGMVLRNPVAVHNIIGDRAVALFSEQTQVIRPNREKLVLDQELYCRFLLTELFNFAPIQSRMGDFGEVIPTFKTDVIAVAEKLCRQIDNVDADRVKKAAGYFKQKLETITEVLHGLIPDMVKQSSAQKVLAAKADQLMLRFMARIELMAYFANESFTAEAYLQVKKDANAKSASDKSRSYVKALNAKPNEKLFNDMMIWRANVAEQSMIMPNMVLSEKTLATIAEKLPQTLKVLGAIKGVGQPKAVQYGPDIIALIRAYQLETQPADTEQGTLF
ncbi:MAG: HRDC domain-containing protein [Mucilaginibacter sp.]|uniref:HRDC domain-containing protein n=1 Tax=Mucilaginibacter sp. TaxID=1882438 RepID=UPI0032663C8C